LPTEAEIRRALALPRQDADRQPAAPDEEQRCLEIVRRTFYDAWIQPSAVEAGDAIAEARIRLAPNGAVRDRALVRKTGNVIMDDSVTAALRAVEKIPGLTAGFLRRHEVITISFKVE
jgi:hypothetical protein